MPKYRVIVRKPDGSEVTATVTAPKVGDVAGFVAAKGFTLVKLLQDDEPSTLQVLADVISDDKAPPMPIASLLTRCAACENIVSREALTCPKCGHPFDRFGDSVSARLNLIIFLLILLFVSTCSTCSKLGH